VIPNAPWPPATNTLPLANNVAEWLARWLFINAVATQVLLLGSYRSELARKFTPLAVPPATSTLPLGNNVAVCSYLAFA
jgi:hypothetical protein